MDIGQTGADLGNKGHALVEALRADVARNPELAVYIRDTRPGTYDYPRGSLESLARVLARHRSPLQLWRNKVAGFLDQYADQLWAGWDDVARQLDQTFDNSTYALDYAERASQWVRTAEEGFVPALEDEIGTALRQSGTAIGIVALVAIAAWLLLR